MRWDEKKHKIALKHAVNWGEKEVHELEFRTMKAEDIMELEIDISGKSMKPGPLLKIAGLLCENEGGEALIKQIHPSDAMNVVALMGNFFDDGQAEEK